MPNGFPVRRIREGDEHLNTINRRKIAVYFQRFPGTEESSGIQGLAFEARDAGGALTARGQTEADGKLEVRVTAGAPTTVRILGSDYALSLLSGDLHPREEFRGVQQRLEMLGYYVGALHGDNRAASTYHNPDQATERAILNFQSDNELFPDAMFGPNSNRALRRIMRNSHGE